MSMTGRGGPEMSRILISLMLAITMMGLPVTASLQAADFTLRSSGTGSALDGGAMLDYGGTKQVDLGIGKSVVVELPRDAAEVIVANPEIANAVVRSPRRAFLIGVSGGATSVIFIDADGQQIVGLDVIVARDVVALNSSLRTVLPESSIEVRSVGDSVMVTGSVRSAADAATAVALAGQFVGDAKKVINSLAISERDQVMLRVTVAEVQRNVMKQLGIDLAGTAALGATVLNPLSAGTIARNALSGMSVGGFGVNNTTPPNSVTGQITRGRSSIQGTLRALEENGVLRTLAEPNLTAISGETANFLAGGEFPVPTGRSCSDGQCNINIEFKPFGVSLNFTPVVLSGGRISLKVNTEVSELSNEGAYTQADGFRIPALKVRRADTTVEVPSGGAIALAGMIQQATRQSLSGIPGAKDLPVLGTLFRSRDFLMAETELVIFVTPYIAKSAHPSEMARPDDGFVNPSDFEGYFLGRMNKVYGVAPGNGADVGFIVD